MFMQETLVRLQINIGNVTRTAKYSRGKAVPGLQIYVLKGTQY